MMAPSSIRRASTAVLLCLATTAPLCSGFAVPSSATRPTGSALFAKDDGPAPFFADESSETAPLEPSNPTSTSSTSKPLRLFDEATLAEAEDALNSVGWSGIGVAPMQGEGEMTSDDPFVQKLNEGIQREMGVGLDELLNPAKVVNLERDLYNLRNELATLTGAVPPADDGDAALTTALCDAGGGGEPADAVRSTIAKKERDLAQERRSVFRGWLKNLFLGQAAISVALSYVMTTNPDALFGGIALYRDTANMDTSVQVLGFWWWWLFIVPSLRSRRPTGAEKKALDIAFLGTPAISLLSPILTKDTELIWLANFAVVAGAYAFAFLAGDENDDDGGEEKRQPAWLKFIYKSLDFGSGRERGARR